MQKNFVDNRRACWKNVKVTDSTGIRAGIENKEGTVRMEKNDVRDRWREYFSE